MKYYTLKNTVTSEKWKRIGIKRRAGVTVPLFSVYSKNSVGIGEIPDLRKVIDWCVHTGMSIIQLLPLNEVGNDFAPYNAVSTFALDPVYLSLRKLRKADLKPFLKNLRDLKKHFPKGKGKVNYEIKAEKLKLLRKIFTSVNLNEIKKYQNFVDANIHWLKYYSLFKILTALNDDRNWQEWDLKYKYIAPLTTEKILREHPVEMSFHFWLQWQLYEQLVTIKKYAERMKILIMGDLPFLVSRNSADVWAYKNYFKLSLSAGAPPDMYFSKGQRWGMPPYNWDNIAADNYAYIIQRLKYADSFYDMFRIDHFVGLFRVWTIDLKTPEEFGGLHGRFDPEDKNTWEEHGRNILSVMNENSSMLPCAEDLGTVPQCSGKVLKEFGVPGINVLRWEKKWNDNFEFFPAEEYRINSAATVSTHDSSTLPAWWKYEAETIDSLSFEEICKQLKMSPERYNHVLNLAFDLSDSKNGRLRWNKEVSNVFVLLNLLDLNYDKAKEIISMYLTSFGERMKFLKYIGLNAGEERIHPVNLIQKSLEKTSSAASVFCIQLLMEYLYLDKNILEKYSGWEDRINFPGTVGNKNWSFVIPVSLEELMQLDVNEKIKAINQNSGRI